MFGKPRLAWPEVSHRVRLWVSSQVTRRWLHTVRHLDRMTEWFPKSTFLGWHKGEPVELTVSTLLSLLLAAPVRVSGWTGFTWKMRMLRPRSRTTSRSFFVVLITSTIPSSVMKAEPDWTRRLNLINTHVLCVLNILMYKASTQNSVSTHQRPGAGKVEVKTG